MKRHIFWAIGYLVIAVLFILYGPPQRVWASLWGADLWLIAGFMTLQYGSWWKTSTLALAFTFLGYVAFDFVSVDAFIVLTLNIFEAYFIAFFFKQHFQFQQTVNQPSYLVMCLVKFVFLPSLILGVAGTQLIPVFSNMSAQRVLMEWFEGSVVTLVVGLPVVLLCTQNDKLKWSFIYNLRDLAWGVSVAAIAICSAYISWAMFAVFTVILLALCAVFRGFKALSLAGLILAVVIAVAFSHGDLLTKAESNTKLTVLVTMLLGYCNALIICMYDLSNKCSFTHMRALDSHYQHTFEQSPVMLVTLDDEGRILHISDGFICNLEYRREQLLNKPITDFMTDHSASLIHHRGLQGNTQFSIEEIVLVTSRNQQVVCLLEAEVFSDHEGGGHTLCFFQDMSERQKLAEALSKEKELLEVTLSSIGDGVICTDVDSNVTYMNPVAEAILAKLTAEVAGQPFQEVMPLFNEDTLQPIENLTDYCMGNHQTLGLPELTCVKNHLGLTFAIQDSISPIYGKSGKIMGSVMVFQDVTESRMMSRKMNHLAHHDALTGLPNRLLLQDRLIQACKRARRCKHQFALVFIDLDKFKKINDSLGHDYGDLLLKQVSERLAGCVRACDTVSRMGGDEFVLLLDAIEDKRHVRKVIKKVLSSTTGEYELKGIQLTVSLSAGIAIYPDDGDNAETLMKHADTAMYRAKKVAKTDFQFYSAKLDHEAELRVEIESAIHKSIEKGEFIPYYQPIVNAKTFELEKLEMLARWQQQDQLLDPIHFIAIAEDANLISKLSLQLLKKSFPQFAQWLLIKPGLILSINISVLQLSETHFVKELLDTAAKYNVPPTNLEIEITESALVSNVDAMKKTLLELQKYGFAIAIDDFGTGFSSLSYLKHLNFDTIKIDESFVADISGSKKNADLAMVIVNMAKSLQVNSVAEGVENAMQAKALTACGCEQLQGYFFSEPTDAQAMTHMIEHGQVFSTIHKDN
ncbi:EAL domain-containing protein [Pseudoalteromonas sp. MMG005]|nr:EAL domain-containing protein [Pseudoalteromonas sp. MMG005]